MGYRSRHLGVIKEPVRVPKRLCFHLDLVSDRIFVLIMMPDLTKFREALDFTLFYQ